MEKENDPVGTDGAKKITAEIGTKEAGTVLPTGPCFMTQIRVRSGVVARRMSSQGDLANI